ncbi:MAG TPA: hypothetical protein PLD20_04310 [Blastocatellia bacterium]|nr:hypothetical protein [Blastocatellia bacterium]HMX30143.1 hypothetical protein [Blastocatellia bacterium]HMZ17129.1 hypothetical protein [Blastocatellia bacterium]HNG32621.1 hypothetical protein [Blastocatellia bacterium]
MAEAEHDSYLEERFPKLKPGHYRVTSPRDPRYNCFAFAANDTQHIWEYTGPGRLGGYFWPAEIKGDSLEDFVRVYGLLGFQECDDDALEPEVVKLAIYVDREGTPCHVARQTRQGTWKSKLGIRGKDIEHASLDLLAGEDADEYGRVAKLLKKRRYETEDLDNE